MINLRNNQSYPIEWVETNEKGLYDLYFTPLEPGQYRCMLLFNNKQIKGKILKKFCFSTRLSLSITLKQQVLIG